MSWLSKSLGKSLTKKLENVIASTLDVAVQGATIGLLGRDQSGELKQGFNADFIKGSFRDTGNIIKDLTGAAAAEKALKQGERLAAQEEIRRTQALKDEQAKAFREDVAASKGAASIRATASAQAGGFGGGFGEVSPGNKLGFNISDGNNFLGI